jgi:hypothetical protein
MMFAMNSMALGQSHLEVTHNAVFAIHAMRSPRAAS